MLLHFRPPVIRANAFMAHRTIHVEARMAAAGLVLPPLGAPKVVALPY
jgi:hypothetical protein